jgi:hypothetical protein
MTQVTGGARTFRGTAVVVGVLYITGTVAGILSYAVTQFTSVESPAFLNMAASSPNQVTTGALLVLVMGFALALVPVVAFPILKRQDEPLALGYVVFRGALETSLYMATAFCWLLIAVIAKQPADLAAALASQPGAVGRLLIQAQQPLVAITEIVFSLGAMMLYVLLYRSRLIPRWISGWGIVAAILYFITGLIGLFGIGQDLLMAPMFLQEMVMAVWLIARGFDLPALRELEVAQ